MFSGLGALARALRKTQLQQSLCLLENVGKTALDASFDLNELFFGLLL